MRLLYILNHIERASIQCIKSSEYQCCSMCTIVGTSMTILKETKSSYTECYLPNEPFHLRTHSMFKEDAIIAEYLKSEVFKVLILFY